MTILKMEDVSKVYSGKSYVEALKNVSLEIDQGEFVAIEGPSGAGKSTLLNILALLDQPSNGKYWINETDVSSLKDSERAKLRSRSFGFVFQSFHLLDARSVVDNVATGTLYRGLSQQVRELRALEALEFVGLTHKAYQLAGTLSGGERQRVAIARAISAGAPVLVADEPTGNLDQASGQVVMETLKRLVEQGTTVILVTHDSNVADNAHRRLRVLDGRLVEDAGVGVSVETEPAPPGRDSHLLARESLRDAWRNLLASPKRSLGLIASVMLGVALALATVGLADTAKYQVSDIFDAAQNRRVTMNVNYADRSSSDEQFMDDSLSLAGLDRIKGIAGVEGVAIIAAYPSTAVGTRPGQANSLAVYGVVDGQIPLDIFKVDTSGTGVSTDEVAAGQTLVLRENEVVLGSQAARDLQLGPLLANPVVIVNGRSLRVVGIMRDAGMRAELFNALIINASSAWPVNPDGADAEIRVIAGAGGQVAAQAGAAWVPFAPQDAITVNAPPNPLSLRAEIESSLTTMLYTLTAVAILAALLLLVNSMNASVYQRTGEFGLRRAIGARRKHISQLVINEALMIGFAGGMFGAMVAIMGILTVTIVQGWQPVIAPLIVPSGVLAGVLVGLLGSLLAARSASRIEPSDALRS